MSLLKFSPGRQRRSLRRAALSCLAVVTVLVLGAVAAQAQIEIDLTLARHAYILYEPLIATVTVTNNTGHDVTLQDDGAKQWFNLDVARLDGGIVQPYDSDYKLRPLTFPPVNPSVGRST